MKKNKETNKKKFDFRQHMRNNSPYYIMLIIPMAFFFIFKYWPMFGLSIAFQNYKAGAPFLGPNARWVGLRWFKQFFAYPLSWRLIKNTFILSVFNLGVTFPSAVLLALFLNEIRNKRAKQITTTLSFLPYFISTTVVVGMLTNFLNVNDGIINQFIVKAGGTAIDFMGASQYFRSLYVLSNCWQHLGFDAIVFTAAIAGIDPGMYEAAFVDGSTRLKNVFYITLPCILPTVVIMLIMRVGNLMSIGHEKVILMYSERIYDTADVLSTYSYRSGILDNKWGYSTAIGLMNSLVNLVLVIATNQISKRLSDNSLW
ncbi:MAG: ABC transporter permease subunit [Clostridia bacterium]|nr:ABC transporter permease subunit [Clostridia bacterium]